MNYNLPSLLKLFDSLNSNKWEFVANNTQHYVGSWEEIKNKEYVYDLELGAWTIFDYYDHLWFHMIVNNKFLESIGNLDLVRTTEDTDYYGHVDKEWLDEFEDDGEDWELSSSNDIDNKYGFVTFGRGWINVDLRMLKNENGNVVAILFGTEGFLDDVNEHLI